MPSSSEWNAIEVKKGYYKSVSWVLSTFKLLERPYSTNCKNYSSTSLIYRSRRDCIRNCKLITSLDICNGSSDEVDFGRNENSVPFASDQKCIASIDFDTICMKDCSHYDCYIDYYKPIGVSEKLVDKYESAILDLAIPTEPVMCYLYEPRIEMIEFVCYLASTFSIWFGVSLYSVFDLIVVLRNSLITKIKVKRFNLFVNNKPIPVSHKMLK